jgi:hypothetical protein
MLSWVLLGERVPGTVEVVDSVVQLALEPLGKVMPPALAVDLNIS